MAVYIDDFFADYRGMKMCHMIADSNKELLEMADKIGVARRHIQCAGTFKEHFDICSSKRALAIRKHSAIAISMRDYPRMVRGRDENGVLPAPQRPDNTLF